MSRDGIIVAEFDDAEIKIARYAASAMPVLKNSLRKGEGNFPGKLGELAVAALLNVPLSGAYDFDVVSRKGKRFEVKTTCTTVDFVLPHYRLHVSMHNDRQQCDYYAFVRVREPAFDRAFMLGYISREEFMATAMVNNEADRDGDRFAYSMACRSIEARALRRWPKSLIEWDVVDWVSDYIKSEREGMEPA